MNLPKHLISLIGAVLVLGILAAGVMLVAVPAFNGAQTTDASATAVAQTNGIYEIDLTSLAEAEKDSAATESALDDLREEIAPIARMDDLYEIITDSAAEVGAVVQSIETVEPETFVARTAPASLDGAAEEEAPVVEETPAEPNTAEVAGNPDPTEGVAVETTEAINPQQQVSVTIEVKLASAQQAVAFIDALGRGPRLVAIVDARMETPDSTVGGERLLTVTVHTFVRTED